jgi:hypothetical protein
VTNIIQTGEVSTLAGSQQGFSDGNGESAKFDGPYAIWFDEKNQLLLIGDCNNNKLRRVQLNGILFHRLKYKSLLLRD